MGPSGGLNYQRSESMAPDVKTPSVTSIMTYINNLGPTF